MLGNDFVFTPLPALDAARLVESTFGDVCCCLLLPCFSESPFGFLLAMVNVARFLCDGLMLEGGSLQRSDVVPAVGVVAGHF